MKRNLILGGLLAISLAGMSVLAGCSSSPDSTTDSGKAAEASQAGGTLTIARKADANNLDPQFITNIPSANYIYGKVYEGLLMTDKNMEYKPALATEWKQVDDLTWEFKLRQGVKFHDGTPFTAEAVKKTMERALIPK